MTAKANPGHEAIAVKGWFGAHKWLLARRFSQAAILALFLVGPLFGYYVVKGTIASSLTLEVLPLTDPFMLLQSWVAGHQVESTALIGAVIVVVTYLIVGGRVYCSWVCPVNVITDAAHWLRQKLDIRGGLKLTRGARYWLLGTALVTAFAGGIIAWELVNPVTLVFRALVFGVGWAWGAALAVFLFDLFVSERGWCSHLCPVGAFYSLLGSSAVLRVRATRREVCNNCMDCFAVCPEQQVITPALRGADKASARSSCRPTAPIAAVASMSAVSTCSSSGPASTIVRSRQTARRMDRLSGKPPDGAPRRWFFLGT